MVELLVVIIILGILGAVVLNATGVITDRGEDSACVTESRAIRAAIQLYKFDDPDQELPPSGWGALVPTYLEETPTYFDYVNDGDGTYTLDPLTPCS